MVDTVFDYITVVVVAHHNCDRRSVGANFKVGCTRAWLFQHFATRYMFIHIAVLSLFCMTITTGYILDHTQTNTATPTMMEWRKKATSKSINAG